MIGENKIQGIWWFANKPDIQVPGELSISERKLELNGSFEGFKARRFGGASKIVSVQQENAILGISKSGTKYSLEYFEEPQIIQSFPGYQTDVYSLGTIFEGEHFPQIKDLSFNKYYVDFSYFFEWVNDGVISTQFLSTNDDIPIKDITIKIGNSKKITILKNEEFTLSIFISPKQVPITPAKEITISQECLLLIEANKSNLSLIDLYSIIFHFERFLIISIGKSVDSIAYQTVEGEGRDSNSINIYPHFLKQKKYEKIHSLDMNFNFKDIMNDSQIIFERWFSNKEKHVDAFDLFSTINSDSSKNLNNQFKDIVSVIEGYVRVEKNDEDIPLDKAIKTLNEELPLEKRIITKQEYNNIRITRNKLSHIALKNEDKKYILNDNQKFVLFKKLQLILEYTLLKNLGMSDMLLDKFYSKKMLTIPNI